MGIIVPPEGSLHGQEILKKSLTIVRRKVDIVNYKIETANCHCGKLTSNGDHSGVSLEVGKALLSHEHYFPHVPDVFCCVAAINGNNQFTF